MEMNKKNLMILGIVIGVMLFFLGIALNIVLGPATVEDRTSAQVSSFVKLAGAGIFTLAIFIGGIFIESMWIVTRILLVVFGLTLLLVNIGIISLVTYY